MFPRWPHAVLRAAISRHYDLILPEQVVEEARRHLTSSQQHALAYFLEVTPHDRPAPPPIAEVAAALDLVRSAKDVPIALALLDSGADILVTSDRDFTDPGAVADRFAIRVRVILPAVFLRDVLGWSSEALEAIRSRNWRDVEQR